MLGLGLSILSPAVLRGGAFVPSSASTAALLAAITGVYPNELKQAWDDAIGVMEADGSWDDFDTLYPIGAIPGTSAANADDSRLNWKSPGTFTAIPVNSPTHGSGWWQGDGASSRLRTQYTPSVNGVKYLQDDASMLNWSLTDGTVSIFDIGNGATPINMLACMYTSAARAYSNNVGTGQLAIIVADALGLYHSQRRGATDQRIFKNGSSIATGAAPSNGRPTQEQWFCGANSTWFSARKTMLAAWGASQAGREAAIHSTFQTLFTAAGTI